MITASDEIYEDLSQAPRAHVFQDCEFINCNLMTANLAGRKFLDCCFFGCDLRESDLTNTEFSNCRFKDCELEQVDFLATKNIVDIQFDTCNLNTASASLERPGIHFSGCRFS